MIWIFGESFGLAGFAFARMFISVMTYQYFVSVAESSTILLNSIIGISLFGWNLFEYIKDYKQRVGRHIK